MDFLLEKNFPILENPSSNNNLRIVCFDQLSYTYHFMFWLQFMRKHIYCVYEDIQRQTVERLLFKTVYSWFTLHKKNLVTCVPSHQDYKNEAEAWARKFLLWYTKRMKNNKYGELTPTLPSFLCYFY
jgi:hypothetical protein